MAQSKSSPKAVPGSRAVKLANVQLWLGLAVTVAIAALQLTGVTERAEYPFIDLRTRLFNSFNPPPSNEVVVVAIDDGSIETVGKWPWPRRYLGMAIRELKRAGASVVALDLLHDDPQTIEIRAESGDPPTVLQIDNDAMLAAAIEGHGRTVQAASFKWDQPRAQEAATEEDPQDRLTQAPFAQVYKAIALDRGLSLEDLRERLLPGRPRLGAPIDDLQRKMDRAGTLLGMEAASSVPRPEGEVPWPESNDPQPPIPKIAEAAASIASVSFGGGDMDGAVRRIPLWVNEKLGNRLYPTLGLAAAALHLGVPISSIIAENDRTGIELPEGGHISIPTHRARLREFADRGRFQGLMYIAWPRGGTHGWKDQFALPGEEGQRSPTEVPLGLLLEPEWGIIPNIRHNVSQLDRAMIVLDARLGLVDTKAYVPLAEEMKRLSPGDQRWREVHAHQKAVWERCVKEATGLLEVARESVAGEKSLEEDEAEDIAELERIIKDAPSQITEVENGIAELDDVRDEKIRPRVRGRICFIGWTGTGAVADFVHTSIDSRTPGVHVHAAVANAILNSVETPQFITEVPAWMNLAAVLALGILATIIGVRLGVVVSPIVLVAALAIWFFLDGIVFWDWRNLLVAEAAPMGAAVLAWLTVIMHRLLVEQRGRRQTEARFRSYVSPDVVDILVNNPGLDSMRPQRRELTIFFSDIAGWTTLAERLGTEGIYKFLAAYLKEMTDILQANRATIDKYLGDGIMAFWGAPIEDPDHAIHAVQAVVQMQRKLDEMNQSGAFGPAGTIQVRMGIASGEVNVGDFGNPPYKSAYTVIGDAANLAARLESANKQFGSLTLMTDRTRRLAGMSGGARLIGKIIVKGKTEPEMIWEPVGDRRPRGDRTDQWIALTTEAVEAYIAKDFTRALQLFDRLKREFADHEIAEKYCSAIDEIMAGGGPGPDFVGAIVLSEK